jgi:hypothetical protein
MRSTVAKVVTFGVLGLLLGCAPPAPISGGGARGTSGDGGTGPAADPRPRAPAVPPEWVEMICDRVEDCSVERNVGLAQAYGGTPADVEAARHGARQSLVSGGVRRWCQMRVAQLERSDAARIHGCLKQQTTCGPFYQCADFPRAQARVAPRRKAPDPNPARGH